MTQLAKTLPADDLQNSTEISEQQPMNLISRESLIQILQSGQDARIRFVESNLNKGLAFQIRSMRDREDWSQGVLAQKVGMNQNAISRLENPNYGKATITTLKRIAAAFDVGLIIRFAPFGQMVNWVSGTPYVDQGLSQDSLRVPSFDQEITAPQLGSLEEVLGSEMPFRLGAFLPSCEAVGSAMTGLQV